MPPPNARVNVEHRKVEKKTKRIEETVEKKEAKKRKKLN